MGFLDSIKQLVAELQGQKKKPAPKPKAKGGGKAFHSKIAGASYYQSALKRCHKGERLQLVREPHNPHDHNAIAVHGQAKQLIGYLNKGLAAELAPLMDRGVWIEASISELTGGVKGKPTIGCNIYLRYDKTQGRK